MIKADYLRPLRTANADYAQTELLKAEFRRCRQARTPFFLTGDDLDRVFRWKLVSQYGRQLAIRAKNSEAAYRAITESVFKIDGPNFEYECSLRLGLLDALPGVGVPVASAVLALTEPHRYCVIDFRGWRAVFDRDKTNFSIKDYLRCRQEVARWRKSSTGQYRRPI